LNEVCKYARNTVQNAGADIVCVGGALRDGFSTVLYWSSSERALSGGSAWLQDFGGGVQDPYSKNSTFYVRPVRAF
jgi:hypothetical protein